VIRRGAPRRWIVCLLAIAVGAACRAPADAPAPAGAQGDVAQGDVAQGDVAQGDVAQGDGATRTDLPRQYVLLTDGGDTIATEVLETGDGWVASELQLVRRGERQRLFVTVNAAGRPQRWDVHRVSSTARGTVDERWRVLSTADSVFVVQGALIGVPVSVTADIAPEQPTPWHDASVALLELLARRTTGTVTAISVPPADRRRRVRVHRVREDSVRLAHPDGDWWIALDRFGHVEHASSPSRRLQVHRVRTAPRAVDPPRRRVPGTVSETVALRAADGVRLVGEFVRPLDTPMRAVVVFVSGSGPQDRDLAVPGLSSYRPYAELADTLATYGVGSVRLDDRGVGDSGGAAFHATRAEEVRDVRAVLAWLRARPVVHDLPIALIGHSDGAHVALDVAAADTTVRRVVLLAAPSRSGRDLARAQRRAWLDRVSPPRADAVGVSRDIALRDAEAATERVASLDPWLRDWLAHDPRVDVRAVTADVLLVHGAQDQQVPVAQADELAALLRARGAGLVRVERIPGVNHLLLADSVGDPQGYARLTTYTLPASVRDPVVQWVARPVARD
jgi:uncharacterized protein